jgi:trimeric autotransporter adhesin
MGRTKGTNMLHVCLTLLTLLMFRPMPAWALTTSALNDQTCAGFRSGSLTCTAGEFTVAPVFSASPGTPPFCIAGQSFSFLVDLGLSGTNADRYNIGFFVGQQGNDPRETTAGNICSVATFPLTPSPWVNLNGDACGDYLAAGNQVTTVNQIKVVCAGDSAGALQVPYVLTYWQNSGNTCTGPSDVINGAPSKCNAGVSSVSGTVSVYSGAYVDITKQAAPDGDVQSFSFTATGPAGSRVIALTGATLTPTTTTGGTYTPPNSSTATNTTTITLTDGQTARFYINALSTNQNLTITESATANWDNTASISCSAVAGAPSLTTNNATRTIVAALNTTDSAASCTVTNTRRSRITLVKSVAGRIDPADQFTVSASGGGTLSGTTSATTAGAATSATTTFHSTPATALTLNDAKASGPSALASYRSNLTCTNAFAGPGATPNSSLPNDLASTSANITPAPGDDITCTFVNSPRPTVSKSFAAGSMAVGGNTTLTVTLGNANAGAITLTGVLTPATAAPARGLRRRRARRTSAWPAARRSPPAAAR